VSPRRRSLGSLDVTESKPGWVGEAGHHAGVAHHHTMRSRVRTRVRKLHSQELRSFVVLSLNEKHSPQQAEGRQRTIFPDRLESWVSHETIRQALVDSTGRRDIS